MPADVSASGRIPWTRRVALEAWSRMIGTLSLLATSAIALGATVQGVSGSGAWAQTLRGIAFAAALPGLWILLTRIAEKRYLIRPSKGFLAAAFGFDVGGVALVVLAVLLLQAETADAAPLLKVGELLVSCGTLLVVAWFLSVLVEPAGDHMHTL
jgi:hypothetical protein